MKPITKYKGAIKLSAIGDALGWMTEFERDTGSLEEKYGTTQIEYFHEWKKVVGGRFYGYLDTIKAGSYSDDTQLLLAVARSIQEQGDVDQNYFAKIELANWLDYARGGGRTVKNAADKIQRKSVQWYSNFFSFKVGSETIDYKQSGANGAAMRILPIALANLGNFEKIKQEIFCNSIITHGHPRALLGAMLYGYAINQIIVFRPESFSWENYITQIGINFQQKFDLSFITRTELLGWMQEWNKGNDRTFESVYAEVLTETQQYLRLVYQNIKQDAAVKETLRMLGCFASSTKGSGTSTVVAGIYLAAKFYNEPVKAIVEAVNSLGADTDSIAAFTGGLIGALHGHQVIPEKWKAVQDNTYLDKMAERMLAISEDNYTKEQIRFAATEKILNRPSVDDFEMDQEIEFIPLGNGRITAIDRQPTLTKGKYNLIVEASIENGQSIQVSKIFDEVNFAYATENEKKIDIESTLQVAVKKLHPEAFEKLKAYLVNNRITKEQLEIFDIILKNES